MSRNRISTVITFSKQLKKTKNGYRINRNGIPLDRYNGNILNTMKYKY